MTSSQTIIASKTGRARRSFGQLWQVPTFLLGLFAFIGVAASTPWRQNVEWVTFREQIRALREGVKRKSDADALVALAENVKTQLPSFRSYAGEGHFLIGSAYYRQGLKKAGKADKETWNTAVGHLEQAREFGVLDSDKSALDYRHGYALLQYQKDVPWAMELMMTTIEAEADQKLAAYRMLLETQLKQAKPNLDAALALSGRVVDLIPDSDPESAAKARFQRSDLFIKKGQRQEAMQELSRISPKASHGLRIKARLLQAQCHEEEGDWSLALGIWQEIFKDSANVDGGKARVLYAIGWCHHQIKPPNPNETIRVWAEAAKVPGPEGQAAGLNLGELRLSLGDAQADDAIADWKRALESVNTPAEYKNSYLPLEQVTEMFKRGLNHFQEINDPQKAQAIAELYRRIASGGVVEKLFAEVMERNAQEMLKKHKLQPTKQRLDDAQAHFRQAGLAFEQAASAQSVTERSPLLWRAIDCYIAGKDNAAAQKTIKEYVNIEKKESRLAEAWYTLGDIYRIAGDQANSHDSFIKCLEYPSTIFAFRARFYLAVEEAVKKDYLQACDILKQNLEGPAIEIDRPSHERSLFMMAFLRVRMNEPSEACHYLKNCLALYPDNPAINRARESLGTCNLLQAKQEKNREDEQIKNLRPNLPDDVRARIEDSIRITRKTRIAYLTSAANVFDELARDLEAQARKKPLEKFDENLLRRAWFGIGESHLGNMEFIEASRTFLTLQQKSRATVEALIASYRILDEILPAANRTAQESTEVRRLAQESLRLLHEDLKTVQPDDAIFQLPNMPSHERFTQLTVVTQQRLNAPPPMPSKSLPGFQ